jgi:predicted PurR-regulated permease PerM
MTTKEEPVAPVAVPPVERPESADHLAPSSDPSPLQPAVPPAVQAEPEVTALTLPSRRTLARWLLVALALYVVGWLLINALPSLTPFIIGLVLAYLLLPIVNRLDRKMPRWLAILTVYAGGVVLGTVSIAYIAPIVADQIERLVSNFDEFVERLQTMGQELFRQYQSSVPASIRAPVEEGVRNGLRTLQANITTYLQGIGGFILAQVLRIANTVTFLVGFLIIPIWLFYILNDVQQGSAFIDRLLHPRIRADFWNIWGIINRIFSDYIRGQLILGLAVGVMVGVFLLIMRLFGFEIGNYILLLAIIAGITELIPIIGPIIGAIPGVIIGFTVSPTTGLVVLLVYVLVQQIENNFLVPRIIGESVGIHPAILTVVLIAMGQIFGLLGVILAAPLSAIGRDLFVYIYRRLEGESPAAARLAAEVRAEPTPARRNKQPAA